VGPRIPAYDASPSRRINDIVDDASIQSPGDPARMVDAMISSVDEDPAPLRLALGSDSYSLITTALRTRLEQLEQQRDAARSTDLDDGGNSPQWFPTVSR
jgi:hypothetical protein